MCSVRELHLFAHLQFKVNLVSKCRPVQLPTSRYKKRGADKMLIHRQLELSGQKYVNVIYNRLSHCLFVHPSVCLYIYFTAPCLSVWLMFLSEWLSTSLYDWLYVFLPDCVPLSVSLSLSVWLSMSISLSVSLSDRLSVSLYDPLTSWLPLCLSVWSACLTVCIDECLSVCFSICLSVSVWPTDCRSTSLSVCDWLSVWLPRSLSYVCVSDNLCCMSDCRFLHLSVCPCDWLTDCLSVGHLSVNLSDCICAWLSVLLSVCIAENRMDVLSPVWTHKHVHC